MVDQNRILCLHCRGETNHIVRGEYEQPWNNDDSVGVPPEGIGIILGVDRILDMCRTVLNVTGDLAIAACVARTESQSPRRGLEARATATR